MLGAPEQEAEILTQALALRDDPVGFAFWAYPWGEAGTPFAAIKGPRDWQLEELERIGKHVREQVFAVENELPTAIWQSEYSSGRGPGKTALFGMVAHWHISTHLGSTTTVAANTENQLRTKTFPEFSNWFGSAVNRHWFSIETLKIAPAPWLIDQVRKSREEGGLEIDPRYWFVQGQTWNEDNPNAFAGTHNPRGLMLLFDEASGIHHGVWDTSEGFFTEVNPYRFWLAASQMRNRQGRFFDIMHERETWKDWRVRTLSTRGMPGIDQALVEKQIRVYGADSDFVRVEIDGLPPRTSEDQFIPWDAVRAAQQNNLFRDDYEPLILGVDPAPRGRTAWWFRQGRNARDCCGSATRGNLNGANNTQIAEKVRELASRYRPDAICIDFGMGTGVIDDLKRKRPQYGRVHEVKFGDSPASKDHEGATHSYELWQKLKEWLPGGMIPVDDGEKGSPSHQMTDRGWKWSGREEHKKILEQKDDMKRRGVMSPDDVDALACTFHVNPPRVNQRGAASQPDVAGGNSSSFFR